MLSGGSRCSADTAYSGLFFLKYTKGGNVVMLKDRVQEFLDVSEMSKVRFCRNTGISETSLYCFLTGQRDFSDLTEQRIIDFMQDYVKRLVEISAT